MRKIMGVLLTGLLFGGYGYQGETLSAQPWGRESGYRADRKLVEGFIRSAVAAWPGESVVALEEIENSWSLDQPSQPLPESLAVHEQALQPLLGELAQKAWDDALPLNTALPPMHSVTHSEEIQDTRYCRYIGKALTTVCRFYLQKNRFQDALQVFLLLLRFGQDFQWGLGSPPALLNFMQGTTIQNQAVEKLRPLLFQHPDFHAEHRKLVSKRLYDWSKQSIPLTTAFLWDLTIHRASCRHGLEQSTEPAPDDDDRKREVKAMMLPLYTAVVLQETSLRAKELREALQRPYIVGTAMLVTAREGFERRRNQALQAVEILQTPEVKTLSQQEIGGLVASATVYTALEMLEITQEKVWEKALQNRLRWLGAQLEIKFRDKFPEQMTSLAELSDLPASTSLIDPFSPAGELLKIHLSDAGVTVWSVGTDGTDDGGDVTKDFLLLTIPRPESTGNAQ